MIRLPLVLSEDEFVRLLGVTSCFHHRLAFLLGFYEGLRVSEVVRLLPVDVDFGQRLIRVRQGKGGKDRNIPINPFIWKDLSKAVKTGVLPIKCGVRALERAFKRNLLKSGVGKDKGLFYSESHFTRCSVIRYLRNFDEKGIIKRREL